MTAKYLRIKIDRKRKKYPHAYYLFLRDIKIRKIGSDFSIKEMRRILSIPKTEWEKREELELIRIQEEKQILSEYNEIKAKYTDGLSCWEKEHPFASRATIVNNITEIVMFDNRQKAFLSAEEWEQEQISFSKLCRSKKSKTPHSGCYHYKINFPKINYKGETKDGGYSVWQFFFRSFCNATDLDYTYYRQIQENNNNIEKYKEGKINIPSYVCTEISNFIKSLDKPVQLIVFGPEFNEDLEVFFLTSELAAFGLQSHALHYIDEISSNYVVIIDGFTTQVQFIERCKAVIQKFRNQKPCIVYFSLMKEFSREEMQEIIDKKNREVQLKRQITDEINAISKALKSADIETAKDKVLEIKKIAQANDVDKELIAKIKEAEEKVKKDYTEGVVDNFDTHYVDYIASLFIQDKNRWKYPVVKYPEYGNVVFPFRRKAIARRGFSEVSFQTYLQEVFKKCELLILGDCNILPVENNRPFEPDIAIISKKHPSIRIDIEIDEPYAAVTRKPIHYEGCGDDFRDTILNNIGWIVIRFTEYQVYANPKECAALVVQVLYSIYPSIVLPIDFLSVSVPKEVARWTEIEAKIMASENFREIYLNHEFGITNQEQLDITDIKQTEKEKSCARFVKPIVFDSDQRKTNNKEYITFEKRDADIQFNPQEHIYLYNGQEQLIPVSSVISCFFKPFDSFYWSKYKAHQLHVPQGQILEEWDVKGTRSRDVGTFMHQQIENYYQGRPYLQEFPFRYKGKYVNLTEQIKLDSEYRQFVEFLKNHEFKPFRIEWTIYDEKLKIAGTIDMIHKRGNVFDIYDWKRSRRIVDIFGEPIAINEYGDKGLGELNQIDDTPYWHYCIQQNLYRYILENNYDMKVGKMYLVVFSDDLYEYCKLEVPTMDNVLSSIIKACKDGNVNKRLLSLRGDNLS